MEQVQFDCLQVHPQEKSFHCSQCDKSFKELRTLRLHLKIHNSEYPEHCEVCKKGFRTKWQVRTNKSSHVSIVSKDIKSKHFVASCFNLMIQHVEGRPRCIKQKDIRKCQKFSV